MYKVAGIDNRPIRQIKEDVQTSRTGIDTATIEYEVPDSVFPQALSTIDQEHPRFPGLKLTNRSMTRGKGGAFWAVTYTYEGLLSRLGDQTAGFDSPESLPPPEYELVGSLDEEPIESHPKFVSDIAGKPSAALNGAIFVDPNTEVITEDDSIGVFREFKSTLAGEPNRKGGVSAYKVPTVEWIETRVTTIQPTDLVNLGDIETPRGNPPNLTASGRSWLLWSHSYRKRGGVFEERTVWKLSGKNGWDTDIYE
jgi:hypothetical protein